MNTDRIRRKLAGLRTRIRGLLLANATLMLFAVSGALIAGSFLFDWLFHLPVGARAVMLALMLGIMAWGAVRFFFRPAAVPLDDDAVALLVESRHPEFGDELISALQLERQMKDESNGESRELMAKVIEDATTRFDSVSFDDTLSARPLARPAGLACAALLAVATYGAIMPEHAGLWIDRCLLLRDRDWPPRTRLEVRIANLDKYLHQVGEDGINDVYVPENSVLRVEVVAQGEVPSSVRIRRFVSPRDENPSPITIEMPARPGSSEFEYKFGRVATSFEFYVEGGDDQDEKPYFRILVRAAPRVDEFSVAYDYPEYVNETGQADRSGVREYNVVGPVGTDVTMSFTTSTALENFKLLLDDPAEVIELEPSPDDPRRYTWRTTLEKDHFYTYRLVGANGAPSREAPDFNISAQPDLPPQMGILLPDTTSLDVTANATVPIKLQVVDDYRVGQVEYRWDYSRDGAFANRAPFSDEDLRRDESGREVDAFSTIELRQMTIVEAGETRDLRSGDSLYVRVEAGDTRVTAVNPEPNVSVYPTLLVLNVREPVEIERELMRGQVRLKDQVSRVSEAVAARLEEMSGYIKALEDANGTASREGLQGLVAGQALITSSLGEASRSFVRVFDSYLFNRMDPSNLTETMIAALTTMHRSEPGSHYDLVRALLPRVRGELDESEAMGKLTRIMDLLVTAAEGSSPKVGAAIKAFLEQESPAQVLVGLGAALESERVLHEELLLLLEKMEEWEDFQDVVQSLKDIIELEKGLWRRMKNAVK